jgi:hypothetical protein
MVPRHSARYMTSANFAVSGINRVVQGFVACHSRMMRVKRFLKNSLLFLLGWYVLGTTVHLLGLRDYAQAIDSNDSVDFVIRHGAQDWNL